MKKIIIFLIFVVCAIINLPAQQKFNVQNGTKTEFYDDLETAIQKAVSGDTIYLPGQVIQVQNDLVINKKLALIGAGCDVDSIGGLQTTEIKNVNGDYININFRNGSSGSLFTGCIVGTIQFGNMDEFNVAQQNIQNVTIWRNKLAGYGYIALGLSFTNNQVKQIVISENIIAFNGSSFMAILGYGASDCIINNNLCYGIGDLKNSRVYNNVIKSTMYSNSVSYLTECIVENNFISSGDIGGGCSNSIFNNNAFTGSATFPNGSNTGSNNLVNVETIRTFVVNDLSLPKNLVIRSDSPCKNAGTDGTDIGIFGGPAPYKVGAVPFIPHFDRAIISGQTDKDGNLKVDMQVSAQTK